MLELVDRLIYMLSIAPYAARFTVKPSRSLTYCIFVFGTVFRCFSLVFICASFRCLPTHYVVFLVHVVSVRHPKSVGKEWYESFRCYYHRYQYSVWHHFSSQRWKWYQSFVSGSTDSVRTSWIYIILSGL